MAKPAAFIMLLTALSCSGTKLEGDAATGDAAVDPADMHGDASEDIRPDEGAPDVVADPVEEEGETPVACPAGSWGDVLFEFQADGAIVSTPAVGSDGTVYFGTQNATFYAVDCNGRERWTWRYDCEDFCPQAFEGSPAIGEDGTIYIGDDIAVPNYLFALSPDGEMLWNYETWVVYGQMDASPALGGDGTIFVGSHGDSGYVGPVGQLAALDPDGGVLPGFPMETKAILGSPAVMDEVLFVGETGSPEGPTGPYRNALFAVGRDEGILWSTELATAERYADLSLSSVAVYEGLVAVVENFGSYADAEPSCNLVIIDTTVDGPGGVARVIELSSWANAVGSPVIGDRAFGKDIIVALDSGRLVSANPDSGGVVITFDVMVGARMRGAPVLADDDHIYAAADSLSMSPFQSTWLAKITKAGEGAGMVVLPGLVTSSLAMGSGGTLYMGTQEGKLVAVATDAGGLDPEAPWPSFRHDERNTGNGRCAE